MSAPDRDLLTLESGLDQLELPPVRPQPVLGRMATSLGPKLAAAILLGGGWWVVVALRVRPAYVIPPIGDVWRALAEQAGRGNVLEAVTNSLRRGVLAYGLSVGFATVLGLLMARFRVLRIALGSLVTGLQNLPSVAWVPAAIVWFGLSERAIWFVVVMGAFPSVANGVVGGIGQVRPELLRAGRVLGARGLAAQVHVVLPAALPGYVQGLKQAWAFSWRSLMAAELITFSPELGLGLGQLLDSGRQLADVPLMLASVFLILTVGILVDVAAFGPVERAVHRRWGLIDR